ncbi:hypothetical protein [Haloarcula nitratireducens]|uniref:Uncharacterized protein n=1 Tax=Haloarcula nitratireducens TaxID=2487749 RepID=A0AAW4P7R6_9EURY|nr:hypothetical protein [Halomicroarcula nitratireducens]MBX0293957.1 hypothetical protein [Halomicroarcula nitratireducens]
MATGLVALVSLVLALAAPLALFLLVRSEGEQRVETDRESAERMARRDTDEGRRSR